LFYTTDKTHFSTLAAVALTNLALFFAFPGRTYFTAGALLPKLYANTIFAVLNSRFQILGGRGYTSMDIASHQSIIVNLGLETVVPGVSRLL
jgi:hypothetical protein